MTSGETQCSAEIEQVYASIQTALESGARAVAGSYFEDDAIQVDENAPHP